MPFGSPLEVVQLPNGSWQLLASLTYASQRAKMTITVPPGFITDFASVPRLPFAYWLTGNTAQAPAVIHDYLYRMHSVTRAWADAIFYEAMAEEGDPLWRRWLMWLAVRAAGWGAWGSPQGDT